MLLAAALFRVFRAALDPGERKIHIVSVFAIFLAVAAFIGGCGGGGSKKILGTPAGTVDFQVQATVQNAQGTSLNVTRGVALRLIVQ